MLLNIWESIRVCVNMRWSLFIYIQNYIIYLYKDLCIMVQLFIFFIPKLITHFQWRFFPLILDLNALNSLLENKLWIFCTTPQSGWYKNLVHHFCHIFFYYIIQIHILYLWYLKIKILRPTYNSPFFRTFLLWIVYYLL